MTVLNKITELRDKRKDGESWNEYCKRATKNK